MVHEILADARKVGNQGNAGVFQHISGADAGPLENERRAQGARAYDDCLLGCDGMDCDVTGGETGGGLKLNAGSDVPVD